MKITDRIFQLLSSAQVEMIKLGIVLALHQGRNWCIENLAYTGHMAVDGERDVEKWALSAPTHNRGRFTLKTRELDRHLFKMGGVVILISGRYLHCRYVYQFNWGIKNSAYIVINLDDEKENIKNDV